MLSRTDILSHVMSLYIVMKTSCNFAGDKMLMVTLCLKRAQFLIGFDFLICPLICITLGFGMMRVITFVLFDFCNVLSVIGAL